MKSAPVSGIANFGPGMREHFLLEPDMAYLNHGSFGASPKEVLAVQAELRQRLESQPVRFMSRELPQHLADAAARLCCSRVTPARRIRSAHFHQSVEWWSRYWSR